MTKQAEATVKCPNCEAKGYVWSDGREVLCPLCDGNRTFAKADLTRQMIGYVESIEGLPGAALGDSDARVLLERFEGATAGLSEGRYDQLLEQFVAERGIRATPDSFETEPLPERMADHSRESAEAEQEEEAEQEGTGVKCSVCHAEGYVYRDGEPELCPLCDGEKVLDADTLTNRLRKLVEDIDGLGALKDSERSA